MNARIANLVDRSFDVVVVGGGIHGATLAWEAARRGLDVALVEQGDFGGATSANSLKIIHGGLRYLQSLDFARMRESIVSRRRCMVLAPNLVRPAAFMVPTQRTGLQRRTTMTAAFLLNDLISFDRNRGVAPSHRIPGATVASIEQARTILGSAMTDTVTGAAIWHDGFAENSERLTYSFVKTAQSEGAVVANYVRAQRLLLDGTRVGGLLIRDVETGEEGELRARTVINAAGPWLPELAPPGVARDVRCWTRGYNIVVKKTFFGDYGVGLEGEADGYDAESVVTREKRNLFFAPWRETTLIGTLYKPYTGDPSKCGLTVDELEDFTRAVNGLYPAAKLSLDDVCFAHVGVLPAPAGQAGTEPARHTEVIDYGATGEINGLYAVRGVKYTTAIEVARKLVRRVAAKMNQTLRDVGDRPLYGNAGSLSPADVQARARDFGVNMPAASCPHLAAYGEVASAILEIASTRPELALPLTPLNPVIGAEVVHAARHEDARHLMDIVLRRTLLGLEGYPGSEALKRCAELVGEELHWDEPRQWDEVRAVRQHYERLGLQHTLD